MASAGDELAAYFATVNAQQQQQQQQTNTAMLNSILGHGNLAQPQAPDLSSLNFPTSNTMNRGLLSQPQPSNQPQYSQSQVNSLLAYVQNNAANATQGLNPQQQQQLSAMIRQQQQQPQPTSQPAASQLNMFGNGTDAVALQDYLNRAPSMQQAQSATILGAQRPPQVTQTQQQQQQQQQAGLQQGWPRINERRGASAGLPGQPQPQMPNQTSQQMPQQIPNPAANFANTQQFLAAQQQQQMQSNAALMQALQQGTPISPQLAQTFQQAQAIRNQQQAQQQAQNPALFFQQQQQQQQHAAGQATQLQQQQQQQQLPTQTMSTPDLSQLAQPVALAGYPQQQQFQGQPTLDGAHTNLIIDYARNLSQLNTLKNRIKMLEQCISDGKTPPQSSNSGPSSRRLLTAEERDTYQRAVLNDRASVQRIHQAVDLFQRQNGGQDAANAAVSDMMRTFKQPAGAQPGVGALGLVPGPSAPASAALPVRPMPAGPTPQPPAQAQNVANNVPRRAPSRTGTPQQKANVPLPQSSLVNVSNAGNNTSAAASDTQQGMVVQNPQIIQVLLSQLPPEAAFVKHIYESCAKMQPPPPFPPSIEGHDVYIYVLFKHVLSMGGSGLVTQNNAWPQVLGKIGLPTNNPAVDQKTVDRWAQRLQTLFKTYLLQFEGTWSQQTMRKLQQQQQQASQQQQQQQQQNTLQQQNNALQQQLAQTTAAQNQQQNQQAALLQQQQQHNIQQNMFPQQMNVANLMQHAAATPQMSATPILPASSQPPASQIPYLAQFLSGSLPKDPRALAKIGFSSAQIENYMKNSGPGQAPAQPQPNVNANALAMATLQPNLAALQALQQQQQQSNLANMPANLAQNLQQLQQQQQTQAQLNSLLQRQLPPQLATQIMPPTAAIPNAAQVQAQAQAQAIARQRQISQTAQQPQQILSLAAAPQVGQVGPSTANNFVQEQNLVLSERQKMMESRVEQPPINNLTDGDKMQISTAMEKLMPIVKAAQESLPQMVRNVAEHSAKIALIHRVLHYTTLFLEAAAKMKAGVFVVDVSMLNTAREKLLGCFTVMQGGVLPPPTPLVPAATNEDALNNQTLTASSSVDVRPGLKMEDLKPPPQRQRRTTALAAQSPPNAGPAGSPMAIDSPQKPQEAPTPRPMAAPSPKVTPGNLEIKSKAGVEASPRSNARPKRTKSQGKFPTADDIMAEVKGDMARKSKLAAAAAAAASNTGTSTISKANNMTSSQVVQPETEADRRQRELAAAEKDPAAFVEQTWQALASVLPAGGSLSDQINADYMLRDLTGSLDESLFSMIPPKTRDASQLSFVAPAPGFADSSYEMVQKEEAMPTAALDEYDWSCFLNDEPMAATTPDLGVSPGESSPTPGKDELPPTPANKMTDLPQNHNPAPALGGTAAKSTSMTKSKSSDALDNDRLTKRQSLESSTIDVVDSFDWDGDLQTTHWSLVA